MISIIIPTYNAKGNIKPLLNALASQQLDETNSLEIFVVDSSSTDGTDEYCARRPDIHFTQIAKKDFNHGSTRNKVAQETHGDILVFMTQDALPANPMFLEKLITPILKKKASASYGRQIAKSDATPKEVLTRLYNYPKHDCIKSKKDISTLGIKTFFFTNVCSAVERQAFFSCGMFPDHTILNEDMLLCYQLIQGGYAVAYASEACVLHSHNYTCIQQFRRNFDIAVSLKMHQEILKCARSESEGMCYVSTVYKRLWMQKEYKEAFEFIIQVAFRFAGYRIGMHYQSIPLPLRKKCSMNPTFWEKAKIDTI